jgi:predicted  nucleic acid-binding Zn-ribbon protein
MNISLEDLINDFPNEEDTIIKLLYYEAKNFEQQSNHTFKMLEKSRAQAIEQQVIIDGLNSALAETTRQYEALQNSSIDPETIDNDQIRKLLNDTESYKRIINSLNDQINSLREMEQAYETEILSLKGTNAHLQNHLTDLEIEYQELNVKYDSLMQNSILPMEG